MRTPGGLPHQIDEGSLTPVSVMNSISRLWRSEASEGLGRMERLRVPTSTSERLEASRLKALVDVPDAHVHIQPRFHAHDLDRTDSSFY